jgi:hypothetical protein
MISNLSFDDFTTEKRFLKLQNKFESYNMPPRFGIEEDAILTILQEDFSIVYLDVDFETGKKLYKTHFFYKDFLNPKIDNLGLRTVQKIQEQINTEFRYNEVERNSFIKITINDFLIFNHNFTELNYFPLDTKEKLITQSDMVLKFLKDYDFEQSSDIADKFKSKLNKTDLLLLLHLLREKGILDHPIDSLFGNLIEKNFKYLNADKKTFKNINNANKTINEIKNGNRSVEKSIKRLKEILQNDSFFEL